MTASKGVAPHIDQCWSVTIWHMLHFDYSDGMQAWESLPSQLESYTFYDLEGRLVRVSPKHLATHESWEGIYAHPAYHYNLGWIVINDTSPAASTSQNPRAIQHRREGDVLIYSQEGYIMSLNIPETWQYPTDKTSVVVKYTNNDDNYTLTSYIQRSW